MVNFTLPQMYFISTSLSFSNESFFSIQQVSYETNRNITQVSKVHLRTALSKGREGRKEGKEC